MADISKIKLPNSSEYNIKDYRIPGVDTSPTSGSDNIITSGGVFNSLGNKQDALTFDSTPTKNSTNPVTSDGIYEVIDDAAYICDDEEAIEYLQDGIVVDVDTKADKVMGAVSGNFAGLDGAGNLTDSGRNANSFQDVLTSGVNIKTINEQSILGSGNINISLSTAGLTLDEVADGQTRVIPTNTSDLNNDSGFVQYGENGEISASKFIGPLETSYDDTENNTSMYKTLITQKKVYTGVLGVANGSSPNNNTYANTSFYFLTVKPKTWDSQWSVKYRLNIHLDDETQQYKSSSTASTINVGLVMRGTYDCTVTGTGGAYSTFHFFQSQKNTSYRPIYYHMLHQTTAVGFGQGYGHKIGVGLASSYVPTPVTDYSSGSAVSDVRYTRTIEVILEEAINCTVELSDELEIEGDAYRDDYTKLNTTYYQTNASASNSAGRWINLSAATQGLYESSDDNTYTYTQQTYNYLLNGNKNGNTDLRILGYSLIGFDENGNALAISNYSATQSSNTTGISQKGTRVYCTKGFDYTKGIRYTNSSSVFAANAAMNISTAINYTALDFRYSDNCIASAGAVNSLGLLVRSPVYLRGTIGSDGLFYLAPIDVTYNNATYQRAWTQDIPTISNENGEYVYWFIGYPYYNSSYPNSLYQLDLYTSSELVWYKNGNVKPYIPNNYSDLKVQQLDEDLNSQILVASAYDEDYIKIVTPNIAGEVPHIEIYENGSGDTSFYYDHMERGTQTIRFPSDGGTLALTSQIPSAVTESTVSGWGFTKNTGTYSKPSGGIPATDLASAVQTLLGKADTALQSYTETDPIFSASAAAGITSSDITNWNSKTSNTGTVTQVKVGTTAYNPSSGVVSLPAYPTTLPASDVSAWAKATDKPTYTASEVGALPDTTVIPAAPGTLITNATTAQTASSGEAMSGSITLHKVAKTGTYSDLIGTPTIPTKVSDLTNDSNFTSNTGTITGITMNGSSKGTSGVVNLGTVLTAHQDISGKADLSGATFTGTVIGTSSGNTAQFRNITVSSSEPTSSDGSNGDIWIVI